MMSERAAVRSYKFTHAPAAIFRAEIARALGAALYGFL